MDEPAFDAAAQAAALARGAEECLPEGALEERLSQAHREGRPLRVKLGIDPTAPDIHLGHVVVLDKLRAFQDAGHVVVLIVGDYTARVGDPSGRSKERPLLEGEVIDRNAQTFQDQAYKVLDPDPEKVEVRRNGEWLDMPAEELFRLARTATAAQILERDDFAQRWSARAPISVLELLYPLLQGYDSVAIRSDVELGGTDQKFNLLMGRDVQRAYGQPEQIAMTMPILPGTDGVQRMAKSLGNYIGITEPPEEIYGKTLSIPDDAMATWYELLLGGQAPADVGPRDAKRALARLLVARFHDAAAAQRAEEHFDRVHLKREVPEELDEATFEAADGVAHVPAVLEAVFGMSRSEGRRMLAQGGVRVNGEALSPDDQDVPADRLDGAVLQVGKRRFARLRRA